jgi:hypothetical protein
MKSSRIKFADGATKYHLLLGVLLVILETVEAIEDVLVRSGYDNKLHHFA